MPSGNPAFRLSSVSANALGDLQRVGPGLLVDGDEHRGLAVQARAQHVVLQSFLRTSDIAEPHDRGAVGVRAQDDVLELDGLVEATLGHHGHGDLDGLRRRRLADGAGAELLVLLRDRGLDVGRRDAARRHAVRPQPDPHRVVGGSEQRSLVGARHTLDGVEHVQVRVVRDVVDVVTTVGGVDGE